MLNVVKVFRDKYIKDYPCFFDGDNLTHVGTIAFIAFCLAVLERSLQNND